MENNTPLVKKPLLPAILPWHKFYTQIEALIFLKQKQRAQPEGPVPGEPWQLVALDTDDKGHKIYIVTCPRMAHAALMRLPLAAAVDDRNSMGQRVAGFMYEFLHPDEPMRIIGDNEFAQLLNSGLDGDACQHALHAYMWRVYCEIAVRPQPVAQTATGVHWLDTEVSHRPGVKVSYHDKMLAIWGAVANMSEQRLFQGRLAYLIETDAEADITEAKQLRVRMYVKKPDKTEPVVEVVHFHDMKIFTTYRLFRVLGASKYCPPDATPVCFLPEAFAAQGKERRDIDYATWRASLVSVRLRPPHEPAPPILRLPQAWAVHRKYWETPVTILSLEDLQAKLRGEDLKKRQEEPRADRGGYYQVLYRFPKSTQASNRDATHFVSKDGFTSYRVVSDTEAFYAAFLKDVQAGLPAVAHELRTPVTRHALDYDGGPDLLTVLEPGHETPLEAIQTILHQHVLTADTTQEGLLLVCPLRPKDAPGTMRAHLIWPQWMVRLVDERTILTLLTREMTTRWPHHPWRDLIESPPKLRMAYSDTYSKETGEVAHRVFVPASGFDVYGAPRPLPTRDRLQMLRLCSLRMKEGTTLTSLQLLPAPAFRQGAGGGGGPRNPMVGLSQAHQEAVWAVLNRILAAIRVRHKKDKAEFYNIDNMRMFGRILTLGIKNHGQCAPVMENGKLRHDHNNVKLSIDIESGSWELLCFDKACPQNRRGYAIEANAWGIGQVNPSVLRDAWPTAGELKHLAEKRRADAKTKRQLERSKGKEKERDSKRPRHLSDLSLDTVNSSSSSSSSGTGGGSGCSEDDKMEE